MILRYRYPCKNGAATDGGGVNIKTKQKEVWGV